MQSEAERGSARFDALYAAYATHVLAYAMRRAIPADAEDATSQTFVVAWRRIADVPDGPAALPWLYATCRNVLANQRRGRRRFASLVDKLARVPGRVETHVAGAGGTAVETLSRLSATDQELLRLIAWEGLTHAEVGAALGLTPNAVAIRVHRARERFRAAFERIESESEVKGSGHSRTSVSAGGTVSGDMDRERGA